MNRISSRTVTIALAVVLLAVSAGAVLLGRQWYGHRQLDQAHSAAIAASRQLTIDFVSISAATVDADLQRITAGATGEFKDEFTAGMAQVRAAVVQNSVESRGTVLRAALVSGDLDSAVTLIAIDAAVKNVNAPQGRPSHYRIQLNLVREPSNGAWLVSRLQFVG